MANTLLDREKAEHAKALGKLEHDLIAWFTTVGADGAPHAVPVWFFWHDGHVLVFSEPGTVKVAHVRAGSPVLVHLEAGVFGNEVVIIDGTAEISGRSTADWLTEIGGAYEQKYERAIADYGSSLRQIAETFDTAIVVTPTRVRAW